MVAYDPVDLLGHCFIEGAQASLHMRHRYVQLGRSNRPGERAVGIAEEQHEVMLLS